MSASIHSHQKQASQLTLNCCTTHTTWSTCSYEQVAESFTVFTAVWLRVPFDWDVMPCRIFEQGCVHNIPVRGATNPISTHVSSKLRRKGAKRDSPTWARPMTKRNMTHQVLWSIQNLGNAARTERQTTNLTS